MTAPLFARYPDAAAMGALSAAELKPWIAKIGLNAGSDQEFYQSYFPTAELLASTYGNTENMEGITAFLEKRKPDFRKYRVRRTKV